MDDEAAANTNKLTNASILCITPVRTVVSLLALFVLFFIVRSGLGVANEAETEFGGSNWAFHIGVITIFFGVVFVALGLPILVCLLLGLSEQLYKHEENIYYSGGGEMMSVSVIVGRIVVTLLTIIVLAWASITGYRLATEPSGETYYPLTFPIGVITIVFGSVYIIIGLAVIADLVLALAVHFLLGKKGILVPEDPNTEAKSFV